jgi:hypothetical protein
LVEKDIIEKSSRRIHQMNSLDFEYETSLMIEGVDATARVKPCESPLVLVLCLNSDGWADSAGKSNLRDCGCYQVVNGGQFEIDFGQW